MKWNLDLWNLKSLIRWTIMIRSWWMAWLDHIEYKNHDKKSNDGLILMRGVVWYLTPLCCFRNILQRTVHCILSILVRKFRFVYFLNFFKCSANKYEAPIARPPSGVPLVKLGRGGARDAQLGGQCPHQRTLFSKLAPIKSGVGGQDFGPKLPKIRRWRRFFRKF